MERINSKRFNVLIVEDNVADAELLQIHFSKVPYPVVLHVVANGEEASDFVFQRGQFRNATPPDVLLMDLNLPRKTGRELIREIKGDPQVCRIPIIMFSTSSSDQEISESYCLGAAAFISKPVDLDRSQQIIRHLCDFWFGCAELAG